MIKGIVAVFLLLSVAEGRHFEKHWGFSPRHPHFHPGPPFQPPGHRDPPCLPSTQPYFPPVGSPPPFLPPGFEPCGQGSPNCDQQTQFQQNNNPNSANDNKIEWVCVSPKTGDTMMIVGVNKPSNPGRVNSDEVRNTNENNHHGNSNDGNLNNGEQNHNVNTTPQSDANESTQTHGGEGLIDVRLGP